MKKATLLFLLIISIQSAYAQTTNIRLLIEDSKNELFLQVKSSYRIEALNSGMVLEKGRRIRKARVRPTNSGVRVGKKTFKVYAIRIVPTRDATMYINGNRIAGVVDIVRTKDKLLRAINHLELEKYLYGVLYREVPHYWPMELLKAQAVAARTFALHRMELAKNKEYDVTGDVYSQVYGGISSEKRRTTRAVNATKGKVLTYNDKIVPTYFHSICGGHTEDAEKVFENGIKPIRGRRCPYCRGAKGEFWKASYSYKQIEERLNDYGIKVKGMNFIIEGKRDKSGRVETIRIKDREGVKEIKSYKFRLALGPNSIRSTNFSITITRKGIFFRGKGWGHGVGMCQWGAFGMSKRRFSYKQILEFYYPSAKLEKR